MNHGDRIYITTPLYYVNAAPHIGHAYSTVAADCLARYHRLRGREVYFLTGTDEHGQKIAQAARERGLEPKAFVDDVVKTFKQLWDVLAISHDDFIRTTEPRHQQTVQAILQQLHDRGVLARKPYTSWYCTPCESFWSEYDLKDAGVWNEGKNPLCPSCKRPVSVVEEDTFNMPLESERQWLKHFIESHPDFIRPDVRRNEVLSLLSRPLPEALSITRDKQRVAWGIDVPFSKDHVVYVWFDALINYISAVGYGRDERSFTTWWPATVHIIGKDILRHHAVYWPIMLHHLGFSDEQMPRQIFAHGWWMVGESKMSKSVGNVVNPIALAERYGADALRYFLLREAPFGSDGSFTEDALAMRINSDLANDLGNLLQRSLHMVEKTFGGTLPSLAGDSSTRPDGFAEWAGRISALIRALPETLDACMRTLSFDAALDAVIEPVRVANGLLDACKPWSLVKDDATKSQGGMALSAVAVTLRAVAVALSPCMPTVAPEMWRRLGHPESFERMTLGDLAAFDLLDPPFTPLFKTGIPIERGEPLFPRIDLSR